MQSLLDFIYRYRTFGLFLLLEFICVGLIINYNNYYNASFLNSSNRLSGSVTQLTYNISKYFSLDGVNDKLLAENRKLRSVLANMALTTQSYEIGKSYSLIEAEVINNTFRRSQNYLTLGVGSDQGITPGLGVVTDQGLVGQVKSVSRNFSTVTSLLHPKLLISSVIKKDGTLCTVHWEGGSPFNASVRFIPRHVELVIGDTIETSGYNSVFPKGVMIGTVSKISLADHEAFYSSEIDLRTDFSSLDFVYVILNHQKSEIDSLIQSAGF